MISSNLGVMCSTAIRGLAALVAVGAVSLGMTACGSTSDPSAARTTLAIGAAPKGAQRLACHSRASVPVTICIFDVPRDPTQTAALLVRTLTKDGYRGSRESHGVVYGHKKAFDALVRIGLHSRLASRRYTARKGTTLITVEISSNS